MCGWIIATYQEKYSSWIGNNSTKATSEIRLLLEPTAKFYNNDWDSKENKISLFYTF